MEDWRQRRQCVPSSRAFVKRNSFHRSPYLSIPHHTASHPHQTCAGSCSGTRRTRRRPCACRLRARSKRSAKSSPNWSCRRRPSLFAASRPRGRRPSTSLTACKSCARWPPCARTCATSCRSTSRHRPCNSPALRWCRSRRACRTGRAPRARCLSRSPCASPTPSWTSCSRSSARAMSRTFSSSSASRISRPPTRSPFRCG